MNKYFISLFSVKNLAKSVEFKRGIIMWITILMGYFLFITAWFAAGYTQGNATMGWRPVFFGTETPDEVTTQAVNYIITLARGIGSFIIGWIVVKFTHKWAVLAAMTFLAMSILSITIGAAVGGQGGYALFIIFRLLLAVGGTTLIILLQPVVAKSVKNPKTKAIMSSISPLGFNTAFIVMTAFFIKPDTANFLITNWYWFSLIWALVTLVPLVTYIFIGQNFEIASGASSDATTEKKATLGSVLREKNTWAWVLVYGLWLIAAVMPLNSLNTTANTTLLADAHMGLLGATDGVTQGNLVRIWAITFVAGVYVGAFTVGRFSKTSARRKPFMIAITSLAALFWILSVVVVNEVASVVPYFIFAFLMGVMIWGIQGPLLNNPYDFAGATPQKVGIFFGIIWGFGYTIFTGGNIILALINPKAGTGNAIAYYAVLTILISLLPASLALTKESRPNGKISFNPFGK
ncbi:hexose phosphate transporter [Mycoplasmopsis agassizii]|uniref:hexose phosphate transporter n=1 Tax=Mycoplasmopsis agassizii TaxID=33922 RepID=UPI00352912B3